MIPSTAHFIWFGRSFPWLNALAIRSAATIGGFDRVVLHHADPLDGTPWWSALEALPNFEARRLDAPALLRSVPDIGPALGQIYAELDAPAAKANMVRAAVLAAEGGVYLDLDTVTIRPFDDLLLRSDFFCGEEPIAYPAEVLHSRSPVRWAGALARDGLRDALRRLPDGWRHFRKVEALYTKAVNNAVVGAPADHPFTRGLLQAMVDLPVAERQVRYALGTTLLQDAVAAWDDTGLLVYPPELFYPLGPEVSQHWFRDTKTPRPDDVVSDRTVVIHWYASVRTKEIVPRVDPDWVRSRKGQELFSSLVWRLGLSDDAEDAPTALP